MASFDDLRRQAERLEEDISAKLIFFSNACSGKQQTFSGIKQPLLSTDNVIESTSEELKALLEKLSDIVEMLPLSEMSQKHQTVAMFSINQHREIHRDYFNEYRKNLENYRLRKDREHLLESVKMDIDLHKGGSSNYHRRTDMYLKEHEHLRSSDRLIDDQISIAVETRENLLSQRNSMKKLQTRLHDIGQRFPIVNSLVQRIVIRKKRDSIIIGFIVFFCVLILLFYAFH
ncbi:Golgi SNAP receptor complex member 1 [Cimex lectularius]|uniref:Golgi SNAP receptor complex member 1 n=1 Tax=Cimex lectularius TaxID=79782 RepID=A0A8I6RZ49_CIMLE|nr:Golgi SNAP receptor complex member 1 [Cimex lectularius]